MDSNELFKTLQANYPSQQCEEMIDQAIKEGVNLDEIRNMLDYIENSRDGQVTSGPNSTEPRGCGCTCLHRLMERVKRL